MTRTSARYTIQAALLLVGSILLLLTMRYMVENVSESKKIVPLAGDMHMIHSQYVAHTADGRLVRIHAADATPDMVPPNVINMQQVEAFIAEKDGKTTHARAANGRYEWGEKILHLSGGVHVKRSNGSTFYSDTAVLNATIGTLLSQGNVRLILHR